MDQPEKAHYRAFIVILVLGTFVSLLNGAFLIYAEYYAFSPDGDDSLSDAAFLMVCCLFLFCFFTVPISLLCCLFKKLRRYAFVVLLSCVILIGTTIIAFVITESVRTNAFMAFAERSKPLIDAIKSYEVKYGHPPESLEAIVPEFLQEIPKTGMGLDPDYEYWIPKEGSECGNPWVLFVSTSGGVWMFDELIYYPLQNYSSIKGTNYVERIGDWARCNID